MKQFLNTPLRSILAVVVMAGSLSAVAGCDSGGSGVDAEALFVGTWLVTGLEDNSGDIMADFASDYVSVTLTNAADKTFEIVATPTRGATLPVDGQYSVSESKETITLQVVVLESAQSLELGYTFAGDDVVRLSGGLIPVLALNQVLGTTLDAPVTLTLTRQ